MGGYGWGKEYNEEIEIYLREVWVVKRFSFVSDD